MVNIDAMKVGDTFQTMHGGCYKITRLGVGTRCSCDEYYAQHPNVVPEKPDPVYKVESYEEREERREDYEKMKAVDRTLDGKSVIAEKGMEAWNKAAGLGRTKINTVAHLPIVLVAIAIGVLGYFLFAGRRG